MELRTRQAQLGEEESVRERLLEREAELSTLDGLLARAVAGESAIAVVEGPAGIGKSSLLHALGARARAEGVATLAARGSELEQTFPFGIVRQLFESTLSERSGKQRAELLSDAAALAGPIFSLPGGSQPAPVGQASYAVLHGLYWLTANLVKGEPLVLAVDDAHWADGPSARFLAYLANRMAELPLLLVAGLRPFEPGGELDLLDELAFSPGAVVIRPRPLSADAVGELARSSLDADPEPDFTEACLRATKGNPFFLHELLGTLSGEGVTPSAQAAPQVQEVAPRTVARSVLRRLRRLSPDALSVAQAVAILGDRAELRAVARLAGIDEASAARAAADLASVGVFARDGLEFVHPVVRTAIYSDSPPVERARRHAGAARILADLGEEEDQIALHLLAGEPSGDAWAVTVLRGAAERARARGAPDSAATYLHRALSEPPPEASRCDVTLELGRAEREIGRVAGLAYMREALELAGDPERRAAVADELSQALFTAASFADAATVAEEALAALDDRSSDVARRLQSRSLSASLLDLRLISRLRERSSQLDDAEVGNDPSLLAPWAMITALTTEPASRGAELGRRALAGGLSFLEEPDLYGFATNALMWADQLEEAREMWDRAIATARRAGSLAGVAFASTFRAHVVFQMGSIAEAEADAREVYDLIEGPLSPALPFVVPPLIEALVARGEIEAAARLAEESRADNPPEQLQIARLLGEVGQLRLAEGRPAEAIALLEDCGQRLEGAGVRNPAWIQWRSGLARAHAAVDQLAEARRLADEDIGLARGFEVPRELGVALRTAALVGEAGLRVERLREAVAVLEETPAALEQARTLTDLGAALRRRGERAASREPLRRGLDLAHRCGATALAERARTELVASGARPRRLVLSGLDSLTVSERRVAEMAGGGLTNREIAQTLFVTEKTVEGHLRHVYRKLDICSRAELPQALV